MRFSSGYAIFVLLTIFAYTRISFSIRVTQTSGRKNGESFSCSSTLLFVLSASSQSLPLYHYLPAPLLLPSSSSFFVFLLLFLLLSSFPFFLFSPVHVYISFLGCLPRYPRPSRFKVFDLPLFLSSLRFFFFSDSSANIPPPRSIFGLLPAFLLLPLHAGTVFLCAFPAFHSIESRQYVNFRASIWQAVVSEVYSNCATKRTWENSAEYCDVLRDCTSLRKRDIAMVYNNEMHRDDHVFSRALQVFSIFIQLIPL